MSFAGLVAYYNRKAVRNAKRAKKARLIREIFGQELGRSQYLAFDPFHDFRLADWPVSSRNRMRRVNVFGPIQRGFKEVRSSYFGETPLLLGIPKKFGPYEVTHTPGSTVTSARANQPVITGFIHDTSKSTRFEGSDMGEAEMFLPKVLSPSVTRNYRPTSSHTTGETIAGHYKTDNVASRVTSGRPARITQESVDTVLNHERQFFADNAESAALRLMPNAIPTARRFDLLREIGELKDLPRTLISSMSAARDAFTRGDFDPSSGYLNKEFGWDPLVDAALKLVSMPDKIAKRINHLLARQDKDTNFRSGWSGFDLPTGINAFTIDSLIGETGITPVEHFTTRFYEWRMVLNYGVKFPRLELPELREYLKARLWGARLRPDDFYSLMPWSWLVDWFTGIGDYIEAVCAVNDDVSLANYGFLTYKSQTVTTSVRSGVFAQTVSRRDYGGPIQTVSNPKPTVHAATLVCNYHRRVDVTTLHDIKRTWNYDGPSLFQASILGALALKR